MAVISLRQVETVLVFLVFVFLAFEDSTLQSSFLGYAGAGLAIFPLFALVLLKGVALLRSRAFMVYLAYALCISVIMLLAYPGYSFDVTIVQGLKAFLLHAALVFTFFYFKSTKVDVRKPLSVLMVFLFLSLIVSLVSPDFLNSTSFLHYTETRNFRPRGFSLEASTYGFLVIATLLAWSWLYRFNMVYVLFLAFCIAFFIQSKGALVVLVASIWLSFLFRTHATAVAKLFGFMLFIVVGLAGYLLLPNLFISDIESYTSVSTRSTMAIASVLSVFYSPFGHGFFGFLPFVYEFGGVAVSISKFLSPFGLNYTEVYGYFVPGTVENVGAKSFFFDSLIYLGLPFAYFFIKYFKLSIVSAGSDEFSNRLVLCFFVYISLVFFISGVGSYISAVMLGLLLNKGYR